MLRLQRPPARPRMQPRSSCTRTPVSRFTGPGRGAGTVVSSRKPLEVWASDEADLQSANSKLYIYYMRAHTYVCMYVFIRIHIYVCVSIYVYIYICIFHIHTMLSIFNVSLSIDKLSNRLEAANSRATESPLRRTWRRPTLSTA